MSDEETTLPVAAVEAPSELLMLDPAVIVPSRTNPRTHFDEAFIKELADSISRHGLAQPILVRPLPGERVQETAEDREPGTPLPTHEIIAGEQRWRASKLAGLPSMPVLVRRLDDRAVLELQLVENLKRKDLHPLEEAEGFQALIDRHGMAVEDIAAKVDKSASQIYVTLKLLDLTPECRQELFKGNLTRSTALLVARAPAELQARIAKDIVGGNYGQRAEPMSYREAKLHIQQHYMLQLSAAVFDIKDDSLVAKAGSCTDCQKRTGANRTLFGDIEHADTCTDPKCFDSKKEAHYAAVAKKAAAAGKTVIQGKEAAALIPHAGATPKGYKLLDQKEYIEGRTVSIRNAIGKEALAGAKTVLIVDPHTKETREAIKADVAGTLLAKAKTRIKAEKTDKETGKEPSKQDIERQYETAWTAAAITEIHRAIAGGAMQTMSVAIARQIALRYADSVYGESAERFCTLFGIQDSKVGASAAIDQFVKECPADQVAPALLILMIEDELDMYGTTHGILKLVAGEAGVDVKSLQDQVKADMKAAAAARKAEAAEKTKATAKPAGKASAKPKNKTSKADAAAGIAQALQQQDAATDAPKPALVTAKPQVGCVVRIKPAARPTKIRGKEGTLTKHVGDDWMVRIDAQEHRVSVDQIEIIETAASAAWPFSPKKAAAGPAVELSAQPAWPMPVDDTKGARA